MSASTDANEPWSDRTVSPGSVVRSIASDPLAQRLVVGQRRSFDAKEHIFRDGDAADQLYKVEAGNVCVYKLMSNGRRQIIDFAYPGDLIGLGALSEHAANAQAMTKTRLRCIPAAALRKLAGDDARLGIKLYEALSHQLVAARELLFAVRQRTASERVEFQRQVARVPGAHLAGYLGAVLARGHVGRGQRGAHVGATGPFQEELDTVLTAESAEGGWRWAEDQESSAPSGGGEAGDNVRRHLHRLVESPPAHHGVDEGHGGRIAHPAPVREFLLEEGRIVLSASHLDAVVLRVECLDDRFSRSFAAAGPPGHLGQELKRTLGRAEIREPQPHVRGNDANQRHARKIVPLRNHLRADHDVNLARRKLRQARRQRPLEADRIAIDATDACLWKPFPELLLDLLGAKSGLFEVRRRALPTGRWHFDCVVAVVTPGAPTTPHAVHGQRETAIGAVEVVSALPAEHGGRVAATVEQEDGLLAAAEPAQAGSAWRSSSGGEALPSAAWNFCILLSGVPLSGIDDWRALGGCATHEQAGPDQAYPTV